MIIKYYIICLMVINTMEISKQLSVKRNAGSKVSAILTRGQGTTEFLIHLNRNLNTVKGWATDFPEGSKFQEASQQVPEPWGRSFLILFKKEPGGQCDWSRGEGAAGEREGMRPENWWKGGWREVTEGFVGQSKNLAFNSEMRSHWNNLNRVVRWSDL